MYGITQFYLLTSYLAYQARHVKVGWGECEAGEGLAALISTYLQKNVCPYRLYIV